MSREKPILKHYTVLLRTPSYFQDVIDDGVECEFYVACPNKAFASPLDAAKAAMIEAAKAQLGDYRGVLEERYGGKTTATIDYRDYEVIAVFEGRHRPIFGWEPELCATQNL